MQGPEILVDRNHVVNIPQLDWNAEATWSYQSGQTVTMTGVLTTATDDWALYGPTGTSICVLPTDEDRSSDSATSMHNTLQTVEGRLMWSETHAGWCIDANEGGSPTLVNPETPISLLAMLSADPVGMVADPDTTYTLSPYVKYAVEPGVENERAYFVDAAAYSPGWTTVAVTVPGPRTVWLESRQNIIANVSVGWTTKTCAFVSRSTITPSALSRCTYTAVGRRCHPVELCKGPEHIAQRKGGVC